MLLAAVLALTVCASASAWPSYKGCSNTYGGDMVFVGGASCRTAHRVVQTWARRVKADGRIDRTVRRYRCRGRNDPYEGLVMSCTTSWSFVRFYANVP